MAHDYFSNNIIINGTLNNFNLRELNINISQNIENCILFEFLRL